MNARRGFLKTLGLAIGASIFLPKAPDAFKWKRSAAIYVPNPAWVSAPYDVVVYMGELRWKYILNPRPFPSDMGLTTREIYYKVGA